jgi:type IV secretory pathway TraG/TraD family ATPase VirD4
MQDISVDEPHANGDTMPPKMNSVMRKWWVDNRERLSEWYRIYFHTITVTLLLVANLLLGFSSFLIFFAQWKGVDSGPLAFISLFFNYPPKGLVALLDIFYVPLHHNQFVWMFVVLNLPLFNWLYSTITAPIMNGYQTIISWTSRRGRIAISILSAIPFAFTFCAIFAWYVRTYLFDAFVHIKSDKTYLMVNSMVSFGYVLMCIPVFITLFSIYMVAKEFYRNEDLKKMFFSWELSWIASQSFSLRNNTCDVIVGWEKDTNKPIVLSENSRYLHELVTGATGTGKTSTTILIRIVQDLIRIARGKRMGVVVLEPKGDLVRDVLKLCKELGIQKERIKVVDPTDLVRSVKFNPFVGPLEAAAETFRGVLDALAGDQDEFFKGQQNETASLYTMLGKIRYGNMFSIIHMQRMYGDPRYLADMAEEVRSWITRNLENPDLADETKVLLERYERVVSYFENDVLEYKTYRDKEGNNNPVTYGAEHRYAGRQLVENKKDKFVTGAKKYLNDIVMNAMLSQLMVANEGEEALDIDKFLHEGGVLLVNTALGELEELSLSFGQFFIRQFQSSVFRRPAEENGLKRAPIFFNIDEFPLYINEAFVRLLTLGRSFKVGTLIAIQSLGQLKSVVQGYDNVVLNSARNKTVFGGGEFEDNERFSQQFGEEYQVEESLNESATPISMPNQSWGYRYNTQRTLTARYTPTDIMEQAFKHFIVQLVDVSGSVKEPIQAYGKFITETSFIKKFVNIGQIEFETKNYKPLQLAAHKLAHINMLKPLFGGDKTEETKEPALVAAQEQGEAAAIEDQHALLPTSPGGEEMDSEIDDADPALPITPGQQQPAPEQSAESLNTPPEQQQQEDKQEEVDYSFFDVSKTPIMNNSTFVPLDETDIDPTRLPDEMEQNLKTLLDSIGPHPVKAVIIGDGAVESGDGDSTFVGGEEEELWSEDDLLGPGSATSFDPVNEPLNEQHQDTEREVIQEVNNQIHDHGNNEHSTDQEERSTQVSPIITAEEPDGLEDLVAPNKKGANMQREIASAKISKIKESENDDY